VELQRVEPEHLALDVVGERGVPVLLLVLGADLERTERLDLVLRGAVEEGVGSPQHVVLAHVQQQLPEQVRGLVG
jgi:hypothetical protein